MWRGRSMTAGPRHTRHFDPATMLTSRSPGDHGADLDHVVVVEAGVAGHQRAVADHEVRLAVEVELGEQRCDRARARRSRSPAAGCAAAPSPPLRRPRRDAAQDRCVSPGPRSARWPTRPRLGLPDEPCATIRRPMMSEGDRPARTGCRRSSAVRQRPAADDERRRRSGNERATRCRHRSDPADLDDVVFFLPAAPAEQEDDQRRRARRRCRPP